MPPLVNARLGLRALVASTVLLFGAGASAQTYHEGFEGEPDSLTWFGTDQVPSGTNNVVSSEGAFHAVAAPIPGPTDDALTFSRLGGYNAVFPTYGFDTSIDVWLDVDAGHATGSNVDYTVAINRPNNTHQQDFIFNIGFYDDADMDSPGAGTNRFVVSASNNSSSADDVPKNPARNPIAISESGWYTFKHEFRRIAGDGLEVRLSILDSAGTELGSWSLIDPNNIIGVTVGGNRYAWFSVNELGNSLFFDESRKDNVPSNDFVGYFVPVSEWSSNTVADPDNGIFPVGGNGGQVNSNFVVVQKSGAQLGLRASKRRSVPNELPTYRDGSAGVYISDTGFDQNTPPDTEVASWNYDLHVDLRNATGEFAGKTLDDFELTFDTNIADPLFGAEVPFDVAETFQIDGLKARLLQTSQNPTFGNDTFDMDEEKVYFIKITMTPTTFVGETFEVEIRIDVTGDPQEPPSVDPIGVVSVEPGAGFNRVTLDTIVLDPDLDPLTVTWRVDGAIELQETDVPSGSTVEFAYDFPLGTSSVSVEANDGTMSATASTTVTVSDAEGPIVVVAPDVVVETDPGKDFATNVPLTEPTVIDAFDGDPALDNDAPAIFPLGTTVVTWTATDASGNVTTATQNVTVEDREAPKIGALTKTKVSVDEGKTFARIDLVEPSVRDNADDSVSLVSDAPSRFPVGLTQVNWTATDDAGNVAVKTQFVIVRNGKPVADAGKTVRVDASGKSGARVRLDGRGSSDPDEHKLTFDWSASGIEFDDPTSPRPIAKFPVGKTVVTLVVKDEVGVIDADSVTIVVSYDQKAVVDGRPFGKIVGPYVDAAEAALAAYAEQDPSDSLVYAAIYADYAEAYDRAAASVRYNDGKLAQQTEVYLAYRYYQVYFSGAAATYAYYGSGPSEGYYYSAAAQYYGQADLDD